MRSDLRFLVPRVCERFQEILVQRVCERIISACVVPTVKYGGGGVMVWGFGGALLVTLSVIYSEFKAHLTSTFYHNILQRYAIPSGLLLVHTIICFSTGQWPKHTSRLCKGYLTKKESGGVLHQMTWPHGDLTSQSPDLNPIEMVWDELDRRVKEKQSTSAQHMWELLQDCWKSIPGEGAKLLSRQRVATLKNVKYI